jgi:putative ABC transport system permease protein
MYCLYWVVEQMTLFSLVKKNVLGNFKSYLLYFLSILFSVVIYYTFVSLQYSTEIQANVESSEVLRSVFTQASIVIILFVAVFIWYSNSFFTRKRKKEVGLFSLLGVRKKTIGKMLFYENLLMGVIALGSGIVLGTLLSKFFTMLLLKLMGIVVDIGMTFSLEAILNTTIVFMLISLFTSIQGYRLIYRFQLIELFQAEKEGEHAPKASIITAGCGIALLAFSYWLLLGPTTSSEVQYLINLTLITISLIVGTYFLFRYVTVFLLRLMQKNKSRYYSGMNLISTSQLLYRIKGNARTLTIIAILSAGTICVLSSAFTNYYLFEKSVNQSVPFSYQHLSLGDSFDNQVSNMITDDQKHPIQAQLDILMIEIKTDFKAPGNYLTNPTKIISERTFNQVAAALNREDSITLSNKEATIIKPMYTATVNTAQDYKGKAITFHLPNEKINLTFKDMKEGRILRWNYPDFYVIVSDEMFDHLAKQVKPLRYKAYKVEVEKTTKETSDQLLKLREAKDAQLTTIYKEYKDGLESAGMDLFLLGFLGLIFLAATGSIIYFKQVTDAHADQAKYSILRKIGVSKREIRHSIAKQTIFIFGLPLIVGICHSIFIIRALSTLYGAADYNIITPIITAMGAYVMIYLGYYVLTVRTSNQIVNR